MGAQPTAQPAATVPASADAVLGSPARRPWTGSGWGDVVAGVTLAAYMIPAAIGDASLARLPPQAGLYACLFAGLVFWCLCGSRHTAITVTSAISLLVGTTLGSMSPGDPGRVAALAACTALMVGVMALAAFVLRAGSLVAFISESVMIGFKGGVALTLIGTQTPKLLGLSGVHGGFFRSASETIGRLGETNAASVVVGVGALAVLLAGRVWLRRVPMAFVVVVAGIALAAPLGLGARGVRLLGEVPRGVPMPALPDVHWRDVNDLLPLALACFLIGTVETAAIGRMFAAKHGGRLDANREFLALSGANLAAGLGGGFPVSGGMSQSLVNEGAGARSPISGLVSALVILAVALFLSGLLSDLPQPVLAAVVLMAVPGLVRPGSIRHLWRVQRSELIVAVAALGGVLASGLLRGVMIGAVLSMVLLIRRAARPHVAFLGRIPGTRRYSDLERNPDNESIPGVLLFRCESSLVYFNTEHVLDSVMKKVREATPPVRVVICDLSAAPHVDAAGAEMLDAMASQLRSAGVRMVIVEARGKVRDRLRAQGMEAIAGPFDRQVGVAEAVEAEADRK